MRENQGSNSQQQKQQQTRYHVHQETMFQQIHDNPWIVFTIGFGHQGCDAIRNPDPEGQDEEINTVAQGSPCQ